MEKIRASQTKSNTMREILKRETGEVLEDFLRASQEKAMQEALEAEVDEFLGRKWYQRGAEEGQGHRNGYYKRSVATLGDRLQISIPRVRHTREKFSSRLLKSVASVAERVRRLAIEAYVRGLSTRDVEETFKDADGKPLLSRSQVSRVSTRLYEEYDAFSRRDLSELDVVFLFLDGVYEAVRRYTNGQALLCAWGICADGTKVFLHLAPVQSESADAWEVFSQDLIRRGLRQPLLVITDGGSSVIAAVMRHFPKADRQRCIAHKLRNIAQKLPKDHLKTVMTELQAVYYAPDRMTADLLSERFIEKYAPVYPGAVKCFMDDRDACLIHLKYPEAHRRFIRTTNLLERCFEEEKRRTKILPQHQHERGAVGLVFGVLWRVSLKWQRVTMTEHELTQLRHIRSLMCPEVNDSHFISYRSAA
jgi:transposase-like protein